MSISAANLSASLACLADAQFSCGAVSEVHATSVYVSGLGYALASTANLRQSSRAPVKKRLIDYVVSVEASSATFGKRLEDIARVSATSRCGATKARRDKTAVSEASVHSFTKQPHEAAVAALTDRLSVAKRSNDSVNLLAHAKSNYTKIVTDAVRISTSLAYGKATKVDADAAAEDSAAATVVKTSADAVPVGSATSNILVKALFDTIWVLDDVDTSNAPTQIVGDGSGVSDLQAVTYTKAIHTGVRVTSQVAATAQKMLHDLLAVGEESFAQKRRDFVDADVATTGDSAGAGVSKRLRDLATTGSTAACLVRAAANSDIGNSIFGLTAFGE